MALQTPHKLTHAYVYCHSASIGGTPAAAYARLPFRGTVVRVGVVTGGAITSADSAIAVAINGTAVTGGAFTVTQSGAAAGQHFSADPTGANACNADDVISFTPFGASGSNIPGSFYAVVRMG